MFVIVTAANCFALKKYVTKFRCPSMVYTPKYRGTPVSLLNTAINPNCMISGYRGEVDEMCALLGHYTACSVNYLPTFGTNYRSHLQGSTGQIVFFYYKEIYKEKSPRRILGLFTETSARNSQYTLCNIPAGRRSKPELYRKMHFVLHSEHYSWRIEKGIR